MFGGGCGNAVGACIRKFVGADSCSSSAVNSIANADPLADVVTALLAHIIDSFDHGVAIVGLELARIRADTLVGAGGCFVSFGRNSSLLLLLLLLLRRRR